jgi:hypothetical protein
MASREVGYGRALQPMPAEPVILAEPTTMVILLHLDGSLSLTTQPKPFNMDSHTFAITLNVTSRLAFIISLKRAIPTRVAAAIQATLRSISSTQPRMTSEGQLFQYTLGFTLRWTGLDPKSGSAILHLDRLPDEEFVQQFAMIKQRGFQDMITCNLQITLIEAPLMMMSDHHGTEGNPDGCAYIYPTRWCDFQTPRS